MAKLELEDMHGLWARRDSPSASYPDPHSRLDNSAAIREVVQAIEVMEQEISTADTLAVAVAAGKEVLDSLVAVLARAEKETLEEADARLDPAATEERFRGFAERLRRQEGLSFEEAAELLRAAKPRCSAVFAMWENLRCSHEAKYVMSPGNPALDDKEYACDLHQEKIVNEMIITFGSVCVEAV